MDGAGKKLPGGHYDLTTTPNIACGNSFAEGFSAVGLAVSDSPIFLNVKIPIRKNRRLDPRQDRRELLPRVARGLCNTAERSLQQVPLSQQQSRTYANCFQEIATRSH